MSTTVTLGFGGKKSELFNAARRTLLDLRPAGSINGNTNRGQITILGAVPMSEEPLIVTYVLHDGYVDLFLNSHLPSAFVDEFRQLVEDWLPKGEFDPVEDGPLPSSIPIVPMNAITKTKGKRTKDESKELAVIDGGKLKINRGMIIAAGIFAAVGLTMIIVSKNMKSPEVEEED